MIRIKEKIAIVSAPKFRVMRCVLSDIVKILRVRL